MKHHGVKRPLAIFISILMSLSVFPFGALTASADGGATVSDWVSLQAAFNEGGNVTLSCDVTAPAGAAALTVPSRTQISLYLNGHTVDRALTEETEKGSVIIVSGSLDIHGPGTITGGCTSGSGGGIWVKREGDVVLDEEVVVSGNHAKYTGGGVYVSGSNAYFCMMDGTLITNNSAKNGGGLAQDGTGYLYMWSGSISNNTASNNGGGIWYGGGSGAALNLDGGEITGNTAGNDGGGVYSNRSAFNMSTGSSITNNTAGRSGGGVFFGGDVAVPGGTISGNTAPTDPEIGAKDANSIPSYSIVIDSSIENGTVEADKAFAKYGETVTLTVTPVSEDYVLDNLTVTGADGTPVALTGNTFTMPHTDVTVTATFREREEFRVSVQEYDSSTDNGRVYVGEWESVEYFYEGSTVTAFAIPDSGSIAASWTVLMKDELSGEYIYAVTDILHPTPDSITFTMPPADVLISATFSENRHQRLVFINDMEGGTVVADKTLVSWTDDEEVTLTIMPGNGYSYVPDSLRLMDVDRDTGAQYDITPYMTTVTENSVYSILIGNNDLYVYADFEKVPEQPKHCVLVDGETENGTISADYEFAEEGWTVKVTANPDAYRGYEVRSVTVTDEDGMSYPVTDRGYNEYTFTMPSTDVLVTAEFAIPVYAITTYCPSSATTGCELETDEEAETGDDVTVWATVFDGFVLENLTVTGDTTGAVYPVYLDYHRDGSALYRYKFTMPGEPVTVSAVFVEDNIMICAHSLTLDGDIGVNFYVSIPNATQAACASFTVDGKTVTVPIDFNEYTVLDDGAVLYRFTCNVAAAQLGTTISAEFSDGENHTAEDYSVCEYLDELYDDTASMQKEGTEELARALATYGYYANALFDYDDTLTPHALFDDSGMADVTAASLAAYNAQINDTANGVHYIGSSLVLRTKTAIRHYFELPAGKTLNDFTFLLGEGEEAVALIPEASGNSYYVEIPNIRSADLGKACTVTVLINASGTGGNAVGGVIGGSNSGTIENGYNTGIVSGGPTVVNTWTYSALSYVYKVLTKAESNDPAVSAELANVSKALTIYYQAADAYFHRDTD